MAKVLLDLRMVRGSVHGIARYALELARRLPRLAPDLTFVGLTAPAGLPPGLGPLVPKLTLERCAAEFLSPLEQPALAAALLRSRCQLFHATSFSVPALWPGPLVATLHDANHLAFPEHYGLGQSAYYRLVVGPRVKRAKALVTISEFSRDELARHLGIDAYKLQTIAQGVDPHYSPAGSSAVAEFLRRKGLPPRYFAVVGSTKAHKNLSMVAQIASQLPLPIALLAGQGAGAKLGFPASTIEVGPLPEDDMPLFYSAATALLFPSRYEGFGLPAIEAMACACPVVVASAGALPEVVGEAAVQVNPDDAAGWVEAARRLANDNAHRAGVIERGLERSHRFSWEDCAIKTLAVYRRVLG